MKKVVTIVLIVFALSLFAEEWKVEADASLNLSQNAYSDNWAGDENGSITWTGNFNFLAEKQMTTKVHNKNTLKLAFGQTHSQERTTDDNGDVDKRWLKPEKSTDLIDFESVFRFTLGAFVDPFAAFRLESQFLDQSVEDDVKTFNPMTLTESFGIARVLIQQEKQELTTRLGAAFKQNLNTHDNIDNTNDGGIESVTDYRNVFNDDTMTFTSKLNIYKAMFYSESDALEGTDMEDDWKAVDVAWENILSATIYKSISLNLYFQMLYDKQIDEDMRFKETLGLGVTYKLL